MNRFVRATALAAGVVMLSCMPVWSTATPQPSATTPRPSAATPQPAKPVVDPCPVHAVEFSLAGQGSGGRIDRYVIGLLLTGKDPVTASLRIPGVDQTLITPVIGADLMGRDMLAHYAIDIPRAAGAQSVRVVGILLHGATERAVTCKSGQRLLSPDLPAAQVSFDDGLVQGSDLLYPRPVTEPRVMRSYKAVFPAGAGKRAQGPAVVNVTVGPEGAVLATRIESSSGDAELDAAALDAAKLTVFTGALLAGVPISVEYLITYNFGG